MLPTTRRRLRIVHLSDLHLNAARFPGVRACLERLVLEVDALAPELVLVSGDLTAKAREVEFQMVREVLAELSARRRPVIVVPGNRDRDGRIFEEHLVDLLRSDLPRHADAEGYPFVKLIGSQLAVVGLDSTRVPSYAGYVFGRVGEEQLKRLDAVLKDSALAGRAIAVMLHHAPLDADGKRNPFSGGLIDGSQLLETTAGRCTAILCGHVHDRYRVAAASSHPELICAGTATEAGREGYWVLDVAEQRIVNAEQFVPDWAEDDLRVA